MHKLWIGVGLLLLICGLLLGIVGNFQSNVDTLTPTHTSTTFTASDLLLGEGTVTLSWSEAPTNATFAFYTCSSSSCTDATQIATGNGSSGGFSAGASNGQTFEIAVTGPIPVARSLAVTVAWGSVGFTYVAVAGIALSVGGAALAVVAIRRAL